jgi:hypothetical protein
MLGILVQQLSIQHVDTLMFLLFAMIVMAIFLLIGESFPKSLTELRRVPAIDALDEAVKVCAEKGLPLYNDPGEAYPRSGKGIALALGIMAMTKHMAKQAATLNVRMRSSASQAELHLAMEDYTRQGYLEAGHPERFVAEDVMFYPGGPSGTAGRPTSVLGELSRTGIGALVSCGWHCMANNIIILEKANELGAFQVGGEIWPDDLAPAAPCVDYLAITEEMIAAGAYLSEDVTTRHILAGEDVVKLISLAALVVLTLAFLGGITLV